MNAVPASSDRPPFLARNLIDGAWSDAASGKAIDARNPSTYALVGSAPDSDVVDVDRAVNAARQSFESGAWRNLTPAMRARILYKIATLIEQRAAEIAELETRDNGMPITLATALVNSGAETFRYFAGWCTKIRGETTDISAPGEFHVYSLREPAGVAALIVPWNVPFIMACNKVATSLAAGCSVVLKPAEETPLTAALLGQIVMEAGVPAGVFNIIYGRGDVAGAALAAHADVDKISFTGSTAVGRKIVIAAAGNLKRVSLELGGKSPVIVFPDADLDKAAAGIARGVFTNSGQACIAGSRVFVHRDIQKELALRLAAIAGQMKVGDGFEAGVNLGPLISQRQLDRVDSLVAEGLRDGAEVITGGSRPDRDGYFFQPTILTAPRAGSRMLREEIFGPVANLLPFTDTAEVLRQANDTEYGLAAAIWTRDIGTAHRMAKKIKAGTVWLNCQLIADRSMPFGGYKQSGWGRENGLEGLDAFLQSKSVFAAL
ncbi:MAG: aldehyde dehydrogenase family protein [Steroidobacteraceae bacterium]